MSRGVQVRLLSWAPTNGMRRATSSMFLASCISNPKFAYWNLEISHHLKSRGQIALRCLEGSTMSNLVHRRRRCARIVQHLILCLEGSTPEDGSEASPRSQRITLWLRWSLFCTANGSYFALWLSVSQQGRPDRWGGSDRQACLYG